MKKLVLLIILLLVSCNSSQDESTVFINSRKVPSIIDDGAIYVAIEPLEQLNVDVIGDPDKSNLYLSSNREISEVSNDRPYNWYIDQAETGDSSSNNCGPTSVIMAALWQNKDFSLTPEEARNLSGKEGNWFTNDVADFFDAYKVTYTRDNFDDSMDLILTLLDGDIILLCIDTSYLTRRNIADDYIGKFYRYSGGHFLLVKGYVYIEDQLYFEVYDSNNWGETYSDGSPKGKDRLYFADELSKAIEKWWDNYFIIEDLE